jgi:hypothetical protein
MKAVSLRMRVALGTVGLALFLGVLVGLGFNNSGLAVPTLRLGPVNAQPYASITGGHVACQNNLPCGPDPVGSR